MRQNDENVYDLSGCRFFLEKESFLRYLVLVSNFCNARETKDVSLVRHSPWVDMLCVQWVTLSEELRDVIPVKSRMDKDIFNASNQCSILLRQLRNDDE